MSPWEGRLIREKGDKPVYKIEGGKARWVASEEALNQYFGGWGAVIDVQPGTMAQFQRGADIGFDTSADDQIHGGV